jgi:hypothetical protein
MVQTRDRQVIEMWQRGSHIEIIANTVKRTQEEVLVLLLDLGNARQD